MKKLFPFLVISYFGFGNAFSQNVVTLKPVQDAIIGFHDNFSSANVNYGTADYCGAFSQPGISGGENAAHSLMEFNLSSIPSGITITSAVLDLYGRGAVGPGDASSVGNVGSNACYVERIITSWVDNIVTWNTQPSLTSANSILLPQSSNTIQDYPGIDVTSLVQDMIDNPATSYGFSIRLVTEDPTRGLFFCSTDYSDSSKHPLLTITYDCTGKGSFNFTLSPVEDAIIGFHDNFNSANTNYGAADYCGAFSQPGTSGGENAARSLMKFDLSGLPSATITSATLDLYGRGAVGPGDATSVGNTGSNQCYIERITTQWDESLVTWNTQPTLINGNSVVLPQSTALIQDYIGIDVTALVQDMIDNPATSYGFSIRLATEDPTRGLFFCSEDYSDLAKHPVLHVTLCNQVSSINNLNLLSPVVSVYPNPFSASAIVHVNLANPDYNLRFLLTDVCGRLVRNISFNGANTINFSREQLAAGLYVYTIQSPDEIIGTGKIMIQ